MVKLESFDLHLDRFDAHYSAGDDVSGTVYITASPKQYVKIKELLVTLVGEAKTSWVNKTSDNIYDSMEPYINLKQTFRQLLENTVDDRGQLRSGTHRFPFKFHLPSTLPSSYEGEYGSIRYTCLAEVNIIGGDMQRATSFRAGFSSRNKKLTLEKAITITAQVYISQFTQNNTSNAALRRHGTYETAGCCGFGIGRINAAISVQNSAFILGQSIPVQLKLENRSRGQLRSPVTVSLIQDVHFRSMSFFQTAYDSKIVNKVISAMNVDSPERGKDMTKMISIKIPNQLAATSINDSLISIKYRLRMEVGELELVLPIGIATKS